MNVNDRNDSINFKDWACRPQFGRLLFWGVVVAVLNFSGLQALEADKAEKLNQIRLQQIPLLEQFVGKYSSSPRRADSLFRLGEAYFETSKYYEMKGDKSGSKARSQKAISHLEDLRRNHPSYPKLDEALFVLANAYIEGGEVAKAGNVLAEVADRYPDSPVIQQAALLLGDHYFSEKQYPRAEGFYLKAAEDPKMKSYILYKLGWVAANQDQPAKALKYFEQVLALSASATSANDYSRDAAREMIWPAIQVYGSAKVVPYLKAKLPKPELLEASMSGLAEGLQKKGEHQAASKIFESLRAEFAQSENASAYLMSQIKSEEALGHSAQVKTLVTEAAQSADPQNPQALQTILASAKKFHSEAQKTKDLQVKAQNYEMAIVYYQAYLSKVGVLPDDQMAQNQFYLAEALFARDRFAEARVAYEASARVAGSHQTQAAWNWFLTAEKLAEGFRYQGKEFKAAAASDENYIEAGRFIQSIAGIALPQKRRASYQSARLLYQLNDFDRALPVFKSLADNFSNSEEGRLSAQLVLDIYNLKKDYKQVAEYARNLRSSGDASNRSELAGIEQKASLKSIQEDEARAKGLQGGDRISALEEVGRRYLEFVKSYPRAEMVDGALWAAFQNLAEVAVERKTLEISEMKQAFRLLTGTYAESKYASQAIGLMGRFLSVRRFDDEYLKEFRPHRDAWLKLMRKESESERGPLAMLVYKISSDEEKQKLEAEFSKFPMSAENKEAIAYGKLAQVRKMHERLKDISLNSLKTLQKNTVTKLNVLEQLEKDVTGLAQMKIAETTISGLEILSDGFNHMASSIRLAPIPSQLKGENLQKYQAAVSEKVNGFEAKGQEAKKLADQAAQELKI